MPDIIHLLPESVANQIAAGEVVQRPASVVKELIENALDAGAKSIKLIIKEAGKTLIHVIDDGSGMSEMDARMCFERHATSKIHKATDLFNIHTLGFRGEAIASITSVATVELKTKRKEDEIGTLILMEGGELKAHEATACPDGTSISVKNLFFNIPVRKNFLKSDSVEYKHVVEAFQQTAMANPQIQFILSGEKNVIFHLTRGSLKNRLVGLFGKKYEQNLIDIQEDTPLVKIHGFAGKPASAKKTRGEQYLFVNGRFIRNPYFNHAIAAAYEDLIPSDHFPFFALFLEVDPAKVDVNVHPTKTEVKFEDEKGIYLIIKAAVKRSLGQHHLAPILDFEQEAFMNNLQRSESHKLRNESRLKIDVADHEHSDKRNPMSIPKGKSTDQDWRDLMRILEIKEEKEDNRKEIIHTEQIGFPETEQEDKEDLDNKLLQIHNKYIFTPVHSGIMLIHQQYAHQRVLYEEFLKLFSTQNQGSQKQLFPEVLEFSEGDFHIMKELEPLLNSLGFMLEIFGKRAYVVNGIPVNMKIGNVEQFIESTLEEYKNNLGTTEINIAENLAQTLAMKTAIKIGEVLGNEEMNLLVDKLFACENPYYSPAGKPVFLKIDSSELDKKFE